MWNVIGYDWKPGIEAATIQSHLEKGIDRNRRARRSSNIVLHDGGQAAIGQDRSATVDAVSALLPKLVASGASFKIF
jgi:hypothetical protein